MLPSLSTQIEKSGHGPAGLVTGAGWLVTRGSRTFDTF